MTTINILDRKVEIEKKSFWCGNKLTGSFEPIRKTGWIATLPSGEVVGDDIQASGPWGKLRHDPLYPVRAGLVEILRERFEIEDKQLKGK